MGAAVTLYRLALERAKPNAQRESGYQERDLPSIEATMKQMERRYVPAMDRQLQQYWLSQYLKLPATQRIAALDQWLGGRDAAAVQAAVGKLDGTVLGARKRG